MQFQNLCAIQDSLKHAVWEAGSQTGPLTQKCELTSQLTLATLQAGMSFLV